MWDEGLGNGDPETHIGQLYNATLRNVRFLSAIGMHTKGMTLAQSKQMFIDEGYQGEGTAEQQAARGAYDPAYLNYTMGKLMIRKLRDDWCAAHPELAKAGRCEGVLEAVPRRVPGVRRTADPAGARGDDEDGAEGGVLGLARRAGGGDHRPHFHRRGSGRPERALRRWR